MGSAAPHVEQLKRNIDEVRQLLSIHSDVGGDKPGRRHNLGTLNKSAIVLLVACWESFVEDLLTSAFDALLDNAKKHTAFPNKVLIESMRELDQSKNRLDLWVLAGKGWKRVLRDHRSKVIERYVSKFHTPRPENVDELAETLIGMKALSNSWYWPGRSNAGARKALDDLITLRGSIAHRVQTSRSVQKHHVENALTLVHYLAVISSNRVKDFVAEQLEGDEPWCPISYGGVE